MSKQKEPREFFLVKKREPTLISDFDCMEICTEDASEEDKILMSLQIGRDERLIAIEKSPYDALKAENDQLKEPIDKIIDRHNDSTNSLQARLAECENLLRDLESALYDVYWAEDMVLRIKGYFKKWGGDK